MAVLKLLSPLLATALLLGGCAANKPIKSGDSGTGEPTSAAVSGDSATPEPKIGSFEPDTLYSLLVAELAGRRGRYDILLRGYLHQAEKTRDPGIAERATRIAIFLKSDRAALSAANIWAQSAPHDVKATQILATQLSKAKQFEPAVALLEQILTQEGGANFEYLAANTRELTQSERNEILDHFTRLIERYPDNIHLLVGKTILLQISGRLDEALKTANILYKKEPNSRHQSLQARLLHQLGETDQALKLLKKSLNQQPSDKQTRLLYAQLLIDSKALNEAYEQFAILVDQNPHDNKLRFTLALIALENKQVDEAKFNLTLLLGDDQLAEDAHYYLAQVAEAENDPSQAVEHYRQVTFGDKAISAHSQLGKLLLGANLTAELSEIFQGTRAQNPEKAITFYLLEADLLTKYDYVTNALDLMTRALTEFPNNVSLLYARAMTAEKINDLAAMERDLRKILSIEPDNANVLNALGYTLADRTDRYHEALELISRANELKPNDPAITDSLGWAFFRLGNYEESIKLLEKALAEFPDHEVAAHLGEVLWITGQQERARQVWKEALERTPDSMILKRVLERLDPEHLSPTNGQLQ